MNVDVVVIGSINVDLVVHADRLPRPGETVQGGRFEEHFGGKGANQAVAAARAGARVAMIGAVGGDDRGRASLAALATEGVDVSRVRTVQGPTGIAIVAVNARGENQIVLAAGANDELGTEDAGWDGEVSVVLSSFEIPTAVATAAMRLARARGAYGILTPAPAHALSAELLAESPILVPNEHELVVAIGNDDPAAALAELTRRSSGPVIVTQGPAGALLAHAERRERFDGRKPPQVVDTTGAGDALAAGWIVGGPLLALEAAARCVATVGAMPGR